MQGSSKDLYWFWRELYNKSLINGHIIIFYLLFSSVCANQSDYYYYYYANIPAYLANQLKTYCAYTVNNYMQVTGIATGENFAFFIYRHFVEIL